MQISNDGTLLNACTEYAWVTICVREEFEWVLLGDDVATEAKLNLSSQAAIIHKKGFRCRDFPLSSLC